MKTRHCEAFVNLLRAATAAMDGIYFLLPIAEGTPIYRERVYCYELYHQLRTVWPDDFPYSLGGEVDKSGHALMRKRGITRGIPDLLVHGPGYMENNLVIVEVKAADRITPKNLSTDLNKLTRFVGKADYEMGIYLVYGGTPETIHHVQALATEWRDAVPGRSLAKVSLYWHGKQGTSAVPREWRHGCTPA